MFKFFIKKYIEKIDQLERQIKHMTYEWKEEKKLYDSAMQKCVYKQKVDWVIGGMRLDIGREIHRPMYGLSEWDAFNIADEVKLTLKEHHGLFSKTGYHWRESEQCFVIDVEILPDIVIPKLSTENEEE